MLPYISNMSGVTEWEQKVLTIVRRIEEIVDTTQGPFRIWAHNQMQQMVADTPPGEVVAGGTMSREEVMMYSAMFQAILAFRTAPIPVYLDAEGQPVMMTPEAITAYRRMTTSLPVLGAAPMGLLGGSSGGAPSASPALPLSASDQSA